MENEIEKPTIEKRGDITALVFSEKKKMYLFYFGEIIPSLGDNFHKRVTLGEIWTSFVGRELQFYTEVYDEHIKPITEPLLQ